MALLSIHSVLVVTTTALGGRGQGLTSASLRPLDAIHLATARILAPELDALVTYDDRLLKASTDAGLATVSPRD